jgi:hypothetical protein
MNKKLLAVAVMAASAQIALACPGERLVATCPPAARTHVRQGDDAGTNGRLWRSRPLVNGGPEHRSTGNPGAEAYGAWGEEDQVVHVRIGRTTVPISPWQQYTLGGMQTFERARQQWLSENGYTGGVRTFRKKETEARPDMTLSSALPQPRATIQIPDSARTKRGFHVDSGRQREAAARLAALKTGPEPVRISWPMSAPASARALTDAMGGYLLPAPAEKKMEVAVAAATKP